MWPYCQAVVRRLPPPHRRPAYAAAVGVHVDVGHAVAAAAVVDVYAGGGRAGAGGGSAVAEPTGAADVVAEEAAVPSS